MIFRIIGSWLEPKNMLSSLLVRNAEPVSWPVVECYGFICVLKDWSRVFTALPPAARDDLALCGNLLKIDAEKTNANREDHRLRRAYATLMEWHRSRGETVTAELLRDQVPQEVHAFAAAAGWLFRRSIIQSDGTRDIRTETVEDIRDRLRDTITSGWGDPLIRKRPESAGGAVSKKVASNWNPGTDGEELPIQVQNSEADRLRFFSRIQKRISVHLAGLHKDPENPELLAGMVNDLMNRCLKHKLRCIKTPVNLGEFSGEIEDTILHITYLLEETGTNFTPTAQRLLDSGFAAARPVWRGKAMDRANRMGAKKNTGTRAASLHPVGTKTARARSGPDEGRAVRLRKLNPSLLKRDSPLGTAASQDPGVLESDTYLKGVRAQRQRARDPNIEAIERRIRQLRREGVRGTKAICDRLGDTLRPTYVKWRDKTWPVALKQDRGSVRKWISLASKRLP